MSQIRRPPRRARPGACTLCGRSPLPPRRRSWCSDDCVDLWTLATSPEIQRAQLTGLHGRACWGCGATVEHRDREPRELLGFVYDFPRSDRGPHCRAQWPEHGPPAPIPVRLDVDHIRPLWSLTDDQRTELRWWLPFNLQLLCRTCHTDKTRWEAGLRAAVRRGEATWRPWSPGARPTRPTTLFEVL